MHGTTLATNILLTGRGAKAGMITTKGFRDTIEIRRGIKPIDVSLYNLFIPPNRPLIPRSRRIGIEERTLYDGKILTPVNEQDVAAAVKKLGAGGRIDRRLLPAFLRQSGERAPRRRDLPRGRAEDLRPTSHETLPVWREFERFNTTTVGAYVGPAVARYLNSLEKVLKDSGFRGTFLMMLANGLVQNIAECVRRPVFLLHSGPAAAPSGAVHMAATRRETNLLSVDMGGTSFDVCMVDEARSRRPPSIGRTTSGSPSRWWTSQHRRRRRIDRQDRLARPAAGRPGERRRRSGPGLLRPRQPRRR